MYPRWSEVGGGGGCGPSRKNVMGAPLRPYRRFPSLSVGVIPLCPCFWTFEIRAFMQVEVVLQCRCDFLGLFRSFKVKKVSKRFVSDYRCFLEKFNMRNLSGRQELTKSVRIFEDPLDPVILR